MLISIASTQLGSAFAKNIIQELGSITTVLLRVELGEIVLLLIQRPRLKGYSRNDYLILILFGLGMAAMNLSFYAANRPYFLADLIVDHLKNIQRL